LHKLEEAKRRDHRRIGKELGLFTVSDLVGAGLPLWLPKGATVLVIESRGHRAVDVSAWTDPLAQFDEDLSG